MTNSKEYMREWHARQPLKWREKPGNRERHLEMVKSAHLRKKYGLTLDQFEQMVMERDGRCDLCGEIPTKTLCVEHDHETGTVRGLVCRACNFALGQFGDSLEGIMKVVKYLEAAEAAKVERVA